MGINICGTEFCGKIESKPEITTPVHEAAARVGFLYKEAIIRVIIQQCAVCIIYSQLTEQVEVLSRRVQVVINEKLFGLA